MLASIWFSCAGCNYSLLLSGYALSVSKQCKDCSGEKIYMCRNFVTQSFHENHEIFSIKMEPDYLSGFISWRPKVEKVDNWFLKDYIKPSNLFPCFPY